MRNNDTYINFICNKEALSEQDFKRYKNMNLHSKLMLLHNGVDSTALKILCLNDLEQALTPPTKEQGYYLPRVPKKVKLSEIVERLQKETCKSFSVELQTISQSTKYIVIQNLDDEDDTKIVDITEKKIDYIENQDYTECDFFPKWLYYMYLEGTIIEVDVWKDIKLVLK